jgi:4a-hydroxytetrahydrobiopterin dehydratase
MADKRPSAELNGAIAQLDGWAMVDDRDAIEKTFKFADFTAAFAFMTRAAAKADAMDHHPEWFNVYATVQVTLATHDAGGVTALDIELAQFMDAAFLRT